MSKSKQLIVILIVLSFQSFSFAGDVYVLKPKPKKEYEIKNDKIYFRRGNAGIILEAANRETIAKYYSERGSNINPFASLRSELENATCFILSLINKTNGHLTFTPRYVTLKVKTEGYFPLDYTLLLELVEGVDSYKRKVLENSIFHSPESIQPGQVVTKLLVFPSMPKNFDRIKLEFDYLYFETKEMDLAFYFETTKR